MNELIREKISLLYDFCILTMQSHRHDPREPKVREILKACKTESEIQRTVRGLLLGDETLNQLLARKGY